MTTEKTAIAERTYVCRGCGRRLRTRSWDRTSEGKVISDRGWVVWRDRDGVLAALCGGCAQHEVNQLAAVAREGV